MRKRSHQVALTHLPSEVNALLPDNLPQPWDSQTLFGRQAPLELEIGSGRGLFITQAATVQPEHDFLGIEISQKYAKHCAILIAKKQLTNAMMVCGDAQAVLQNKIPDQSLAAVHIYFPDPWWKRRHRKRRIVCEPVIRLIHQKLIPAGKLHFWTDVEEYFLAGRQCIAHVPGFDGPIGIVEHVAEHDFDYRTHFERRTRLHGEPVFRALYEKLPFTSLPDF
ncbi:MAG: tRNA (guanosine(46)-N7)-methyltransferase TrmB [Planctomycetaceae bacterium]|nr:tRNA (guanosine(46)-N7)-methyltransferase TrmB [Planctomycetaceae bacterium]